MFFHPKVLSSAVGFSVGLGRRVSLLIGDMALQVPYQPSPKSRITLPCQPCRKIESPPPTNLSKKIAPPSCANLSSKINLTTKTLPPLPTFPERSNHTCPSIFRRWGWGGESRSSSEIWPCRSPSPTNFPSKTESHTSFHTNWSNHIEIRRTSSGTSSCRSPAPPF